MSLSDTMHPVCPVRHRGVRRDREPLVHRAAFVGLVVAEGDPAQPLGRDQPADRRADERETSAEPVWNSSGSSPRMRNWLKVMPAGGAISGTKVESR
jgi:hypothetical protein